MDLMFVHPKRWAKFNSRSYRNTEEEKRRLNRYMEQFVEPMELIKNKEIIRKMLRTVGFEIPARPIEARRISSYKHFLANVLAIIDAAYSDE